MPRMLKPRSLEHNSRNIEGRRERLRVNRDDLAKELEKDKHDRKKPSETWTRLEEFGNFEDLLTFRRPNPCYIPMLDATIVSCHLFDVFPTATNKICLFKTFVCIVCIPLYLSYLTPKPMDPIEDELRRTHIFGTDKSMGDRQQHYSRKGYDPACSSVF